MVEIDPAVLEFLTPEERVRFDDLLTAKRQLWTPLAGPQTLGYVSEADVLGYGGAAGGGKSDLCEGLAVTEHRRIGIFRQNGTELSALIDRMGEILGSRDGLSEQKGIWRAQRPDGTPFQVEFGSFPHPGDEKKYQGRPHDLLIFDEAQNMREKAVRFLLGWLRTTDKNQRTRAVFTFNPPTDAIGQWVVSFFGPWLDEAHRNPAEPGELRWFTTLDGADVEVGSGEHFEHKGEVIRPQSRTFIPSRVSDNPYLSGTNYVAQLQALEEPLRSQMLHGDFKAGMEDDAWQVIPTDWVEAAQARWVKPLVLPEMESIGMDVAMGGRDQTIIARRHVGQWFDEPIVYPGKDCLDGPTVAGFGVSAIRNRAVIHIDLLGVGSKPYGHLMGMGIQVIGVMVGEPAGGMDTTGRWRFKNLRSNLWWNMREALDPDNNTGICLPPDLRVKADLTAPKWKPVGTMIQVEPSDDLKKRIGRSPDYGVAYVLALMDTPKLDRIQSIARGRQREEYNPYENM